MKVFLGIPAGAALAAAAGSLAGELRERAGVLAPGARISWVPPERFHVTVLFIGHVTPDRLDALRGALDRPFDEPSFEMTARGAGAFPRTGSPRVVWTGFASGHEAFVRLSRETAARVSPLTTIEVEHDAQPHLTLARVKEPAGLRTHTWLAGFDTRALGALAIEAITLFESRPVHNGVEYVPLLQAALQPGRAA